MSFGYIITLGERPNTYTGLRYATSISQISLGELFVESLEGWSQEAPPVLPPTPHQKKEQLVGLFSQLPLATRAGFADVASKVYNALDIADVELAVYFVTLAGQAPNADAQLIQQLLNILEASQAVEGVSQQEVDYLVSKVNEVP